MHSKRVFVLALLFSGPVMAQTIAQKTAHKYWQDQMDGQMSFTNKNCGTTIADPIDYATFDGTDTSSVSVGQYCSEAATAVSNICNASADNKPAVKKGVSKIVCTYGGPGKRNISLSGGTLTYTVDFKVGVTSTQFIQGFVANHI